MAIIAHVYPIHSYFLKTTNPTMKKITTLLLLPLFLIISCAGSSKLQSSRVFKFTDDNFHSTVLEKKGVTVIEFWAEWCGSCKMVDPIITELANVYGNKVNIGKMNVDLGPEISTKFNIKSIPTILIFKNGKVTDKHVGVISKATLKNKIDVLL